MAAIQAASADVLRVEEGSLYPALHRMEESGWLRAGWTTTDGGRRIRAYRLTPTGRKQLGSEETRWQQLSDAVNRVLKTV
jgi:DNA-binding PadR family transcriptional regulator